ncbi:MAG: O-antigen ligase family protein [Candidatus Tritonobacter lacicola]|nr:O-antigen ligase family protein [Candidatus Tritonobacter lacicola]
MRNKVTNKAFLAGEGVPPPINWKLYIGLVFAGLIAGKVVAMSQRGAVGTPEMRLLVLVSAQIVLFILALFSEKFSYFALIIYIPFSLKLPGDYGFAVNIANILILITFFGLIMRSVKTGETFFEKTSLDKLIVLWLVLLTMAFMHGAYFADKDWTVLAICLKRFLTPLLIYFLTFWVIRDREYLKDTLVVLLLGLSLAAFLNIKDAWVPTHFRWEKRWGEVASQGNLFAAFLVYNMFILLAIFWQNIRKPLYWGLLIPFFWCLRSIMLSYSRGGWIALSVASIAFAFLKNKFIGVAVLILFLMIYKAPHAFLPGSVAERITSTSTVSVHRFEEYRQYEVSAESRLVLWKGAIKMIAKNPVLGVGYMWSRKLIHEYAPVRRGRDLHNGYLSLAAEMGLPTLIVFIILIHHIFKATWVVYRKCPDPLLRATAHGFLAGIVGFIVANMFGDRFSSEETITYFWIIAAIIMKVKTVMDREALPVMRQQGSTE